MYEVADNALLIVTDDPDEQIITVKCEPEQRAGAGARLRLDHTGPPSRQEALDLAGARAVITKHLINDAAEHSYDLVIDGLPQARARMGRLLTRL
ncbi:MmcQ/YjbR family DNA-binding protein [Streptomyces luteogriseus]|uniref:hypothetical protein n=1 Tax=Streptomyces luteogriseus TaxID=68233 RepID=UPI0036C3EE19